MRKYVVANAEGLSPYNFSHQGPLWWGVVGLITIEATVFATLVSSYFYIRMDQPQWPPAGVGMPDLLLPTVNTLILFASILPIHWADKGIKRDDTRALVRGLSMGVVLATIFLGLKVFEFAKADYRWDSHPYGSIVWLIAGFHSLHVLTLVMKTAVILVLAWRGYFTQQRRLGVEIQGNYWHFVVVVWLPLYIVIYWSPRWF